MRMTTAEHIENAQDWIGQSNGSYEKGEVVNRQWLREQMHYTIADDDDIEAIATIIESH